MCVYVCVRRHISDMYGPIIFVLGTKTTHDSAHMHIVLFLDAIKAILVVTPPPPQKNPGAEHILNHFSDMHLPMLLKLGRPIKNVGLHKHFIYFRD